MPVWAFGALAGGAASMASDFASSYLIPHIPEPDRLKALELAWLPVGASAGAWYLTVQAGAPALFNDIGVAGVLAIGAVSEMVALKVQESLFADSEDING